MYALFYDNNFSQTDEIELEEVHSFTRDTITHAGGRLNNVSSLFIICSEEERGDVTEENLLAFQAPLIIKKLAEQNEQIIKEGFYSESLDANFSFDSKDQDNISQELTLLTAGLAEELHEWNTVDKGVIYMTDEEFRTFCVEAGAHKRFHMSRYWRIKDKVMNCTSLECLHRLDDIETAEDILDSYT